MINTAGELESFGDRLNAVVIGASGGIGGAFAARLEESPRVEMVIRTSRTGGGSTRVDLTDEDSIADLAAKIREKMPDGLDLVLVASGFLHDEALGLAPEKTWRHLDPAAMARSFQINTIGPALVAKHLLPLLRRDRKAAFAAISAKVGSISDNGLGGWYAYRASKAALNMTIRNLAIELARKAPRALCVGLHPGTVDTGLSKPFQANVPGGKLFTPNQSAAYLLDALDAHGAESTGQLIGWDGRVIAP